MFNIGGGEILVIALIALIAVGPEQLPGVMRKVGGFVGQVRGMTAGLRDEFMSGVDEIKSEVGELDPNRWMGDGSDDKPIVPRGYAENSIKSPVDPEPHTPSQNGAEPVEDAGETASGPPAETAASDSSDSDDAPEVEESG